MNDELLRVNEELASAAQECERASVSQWSDVWRAYKAIDEAMSRAIETLWNGGELRWAAGLQSRLVDVKRQGTRHLRAMYERHVNAQRGG